MTLTKDQAVFARTEAERKGKAQSVGPRARFRQFDPHFATAEVGAQIRP